jgi:uncharacterized membrane protein
LVAIALFFIMLVLLPLLFADLMAAALVKLHLDPSTALILVVEIMFGSLINIPVKRIMRTEAVIVHPLASFGCVLPQLCQLQRQTIVAVNVGGCVIPPAIVIYEIVEFERRAGAPALLALGIASIGGAGTFDGIVFSCIVAAYLA